MTVKNQNWAFLWVEPETPLKADTVICIDEWSWTNNWQYRQQFPQNLQKVYSKHCSNHQPEQYGRLVLKNLMFSRITKIAFIIAIVDWQKLEDAIE